MKLANECWALIPARSGSKTIKNKNIKKLNKKPLIYYSLALAKKCKVFKKIIFSSDSKTYLKIASKYGKFYLHHRGYASSTDTATDLDVFKGFIRDYLKKNQVLPKYFAHLRPTTPVRNIKTVNKVLKIFFRKKNFSSLRTVTCMSESSYKSLRIFNKKLCSIFNKDFDIDKFNKPKSSYPTTYVANGILDIYLTKNILKNTLLGKKSLAYITNEFNSDIDTRNDLENVKIFLKRKQ